MLNTKPARNFYFCDNLDNYEESEYNLVEPNEANLVSSLCQDGKHRPALDLDLSAQVFPSSTPGHCHLYIDTPMTWQVYMNLLNALVAAGVLDPKYVDHSVKRGSTMLRLPHIVKPVPVQFPKKVR